MLILLILLIAPSSGLHSNELGSTKGAKVFRIYPEDERQLKYLQSTLKSEVADFWTLPRQIRKSVDYMTIEWMVPVMQNMLKTANITYSIIRDNVETDIKRHLEEVNQKKGDLMDWESFYQYSEILTWMHQIQSKYPSLVTLKQYGQSFEGRELVLIKLSKGEESKSAVWINGGIQGKEWITVSTTTYLINRIVTADDNLLDHFDFYLVPVVNPDSYVYTWSNVRLWSKTRSDKKLANQCVGANINRNWDINWNENKNTSPCSDSYPGTKVFSEIESQALKEEIQNVSSDIKVFLNFHSYGQKWLSACSYSGRYEEECKSMNEIGKEAAAASSSKTRKYDYIHGASLDPNFSLSGTLIEWAKFAADIPYAFVAELPDRGATGFFLPVEEIKSVGEEIFFGVSSLLKFVQSSSNMENIKDEL